MIFYDDDIPRRPGFPDLDYFSIIPDDLLAEVSDREGLQGGHSLNEDVSSVKKFIRREHK